MTHAIRRFGALLLVSLLASPFPAKAATPADTLVVADVAEPVTLDPQAATTPAEFRILSAIFDGLVQLKPGTMEVEPDLAERWSVSPDGLIYRFDLKSGLRFQDGTPLDARAVAGSFQRLLDPAKAEAGAFPLAFIFATVAHVEATDGDTVEFRLRQPYAPFLASLATPTGFILSATSPATGDATIARRPIGTGPYRLTSWTAGKGVVLERNPFFRAEAADLARIEIQPIADPAERLAALKAGRVDIATEPDRAALPLLRTSSGAGAPVLVEAIAPHLWFLILNTREGVFSDKRVRQAVNFAIDRDRLIETVLGGAAVKAAGPVPSAFGASATGTAPYPHDPAKARELIRAAGAEGRSVSFLAARNGIGMLEPVAMAERIAADLAAVGLDAKIQTYEWNTFLSNVNPGLSGRADMAEMAWTVFDPDTLPFLALHGGARPGAGGFNAGGYSNGDIDQRLEAARAARDPALRSTLYSQIQRRVHEDAPFAFVVEGKVSLVAAPGLSGVRIEPSGVIDFSHITKP